MSGGEFIVMAFLAMIAAFVAILIGVARLLYRLADRGARRTWTTLSQSPRNIFGPDGPPEDLCKRLREKHRDLSPGIQGGLFFDSSGCKGRLDFIAGRTEIRFQLDDRAKDSMEVSTASFMTQLAEDDPDAFRVRGSESLYRQVFSNPDLARMLRGWNVPFEWSVGPAGFVLQIRELPSNEEELWRWLKGAYRLLEAVPGFQSLPSVQITKVSRAALAEGQCQICGASLGQGTVVHCSRCATPHHEDCWSYAGECSTFACKERRFVR